MLMNRAVARKEDAVLHMAMAAKQRPVGQDDLVAHGAIMCNMASSHEEVVVADACLESLSGASVNGDILAKDVVVADHRAGILAAELEVLGHLTDDRPAVDRVALTHFQWADQNGMGAHHATGTQAYPALDRKSTRLNSSH